MVCTFPKNTFEVLVIECFLEINVSFFHTNSITNTTYIYIAAIKQLILKAVHLGYFKHKNSQCLTPPVGFSDSSDERKERGVKVCRLCFI